MQQKQRIPLTVGHPHHNRQHAAQNSRPAIIARGTVVCPKAAPQRSDGPIMTASPRDRKATELSFLGEAQAVTAGALAALLTENRINGNAPPPEIVFRLSAEALNEYRPSSAVRGSRIKVRMPKYRSLLYNMLQSRYFKDAMVLRRWCQNWP